MLSPRSRGKGGRRFPKRDGGRRKQKRPVWRKQATHAADDVTELLGDSVVLTHRVPWGQTPAEWIYLLDQQTAGTGIRYHAELSGPRGWRVFNFRVAVDDAETVRVIMALLK